MLRIKKMERFNVKDSTYPNSDYYQGHHEILSPKQVELRLQLQQLQLQDHQAMEPPS